MLVCLFFWLTTAHTLGQDILEFRQSPTSVNATLGSEARFPCQANRACMVGWNVNGAPLRSPAIVDHVTAVAGAEKYHVLTVPATHEFNNSYIQCVLIDYDNALRNAVSPIATLMLQGYLDSVSNFQAACNENSILLSWSPPFSLDVTGVDPDIWYTVLISNVTDKDNPTAVPCTDCHNLTQPHYTFTNDTQSQNPCPISLYSFEIIPVNAAGEGHHTLPLTLGFAGDIAIETEVEVQFTPSATLKIYIWPPLCDHYVSVEVTSEESQSEDWAVGPLLVPQANGTLIIDSSSGLEEDSFYTVALTVSNRCKTVLKSHSISTYRIQDIITENVDDSLRVVCVLAAPSMTQGCYVIITQDMLIAASAFLLVGEGNMSVSHVFRGLRAGSYSVVVYSVKNSMMFEVNGRPVFTREVNVTGPSSVASAVQPTVAADSIVEILAPTVSTIHRRSEKNVGIIHSVLTQAIIATGGTTIIVGLTVVIIICALCKKWRHCTIKQKIPVKCNTAYEECHLRGQNATSTTNSEDPIYEKIH